MKTFMQTLALTCLAVAVHAKKTMEEYCWENGYAVQEYTVVTPDDYILSIYRIPGLLSDIGKKVNKPAVLMMHGLDADMTQWIANKDP